MSPRESGPGGNPYIDSLSSGLERLGIEVDQFRRKKLLEKYDIVHVHWPSPLIRWNSKFTAIRDMVKVLTFLSIARRRGARLVWTAHDLAAHEVRHPRLYRLYQRLFTKRVDDVISLTEAAIPLLQSSYRGLDRKQIHVVPHGHYRDAYPHVEELAADSKAAFDIPIDSEVILVLGQLRPYKGIDEMIRMYQRAHLPRTHLVIAGESKDSSHTDDLKQLIDKTENASILVGKLPESTVSRLLNASSVVLASYSEGSSLNSGAALLALSFDRPVVVRDTPVMRELRDSIGSRWVHLAKPGDEEFALRTALTTFPRLRGSQPVLDRLNWDEIVLQTAAVYRDRTARVVKIDDAQLVMR